MDDLDLDYPIEDYANNGNGYSARHSGDECGGSHGSGSDPRLQTSNLKPPHLKDAKARAKLSEKIIWNGYSDTFLSFRRAIEGHLLQVNAGYMIDPVFLDFYTLNPTKYHYEPTFHKTCDVWRYFQQSCHQIRYDSEYFYGMLMGAWCM